MKNKKKLSRYSWILLVLMFNSAVCTTVAFMEQLGCLCAIMFTSTLIMFMAFACAPDNEKYTYEKEL